MNSSDFAKCMSSAFKWKLLAISGWLFVSGLVVFEALGMLQTRDGASFRIDSPDRSTTALLYSYRKSGPLVHDTNVWIEVYIQKDGDSDILDPKNVRFSCPAKEVKDEMYARDYDGAISWSPDSKLVRVKLPRVEILISK